jgi:hypothetical protein
MMNRGDDHDEPLDGNQAAMMDGKQAKSAPGRGIGEYREPNFRVSFTFGKPKQYGIRTLVWDEQSIVRGF